MKLLLLAFFGVIPAMTASAATTPFFMFTAAKFADAGEGEAIADVLRQHVTSRDYLSSRLGQELPELALRVGPAHLYFLAPSLAQIAREGTRGCGPGAPGLVIYDGEHWLQTPLSEQTDMVRAVADGKALVSGARCRAYGVAPDGQFLGIYPGTGRYDLNRSIHRRIDWAGIALFDIQAQRLLDDGCSGHADSDTYVEFVATVAREVRAGSPPTKIVAQLSFRFTPPETMIAASARLAGIVDGFYVAYPRNVGRNCKYCSPDNLAQVLSALPGRSPSDRAAVSAVGAGAPEHVSGAAIIQPATENEEVVR